VAVKGRSVVAVSAVVALFTGLLWSSSAGADVGAPDAAYSARAHTGLQRIDVLVSATRTSGELVSPPTPGGVFAAGSCGELTCSAAVEIAPDGTPGPLRRLPVGFFPQRGVPVAGGLLLAGRFSTPNGADAAVVRLRSDGTLDLTFGNGGIALLGLDTSQNVNTSGLAADLSGAVAVTASGEFLRPGCPARTNTVALLTPSGQLDPAFANGGRLTPRLQDSDRIGDVLWTGDRLLIAASLNRDVNGGPQCRPDWSTSTPALLAFTRRGGIDTTYGFSGLAALPARPAMYGQAAAPSLADQGSVQLVARQGGIRVADGGTELADARRIDRDGTPLVLEPGHRSPVVALADPEVALIPLVDAAVGSTSYGTSDSVGHVTWTNGEEQSRWSGLCGVTTLPSPGPAAVTPVPFPGSNYDPQVFVAQGADIVRLPWATGLPSATVRTDRGFWTTGADGTVRTAGDATPCGGMNATRLAQPVVGIAVNPARTGYWLVARDGGIFAFGQAAFRGSTGNIHLNQPIVGMASTPTGLGYWLVARDGGIFAFGDAAFRGSTGNIHLNQPIVGMASTPTGLGYWLVARDGGIFAFGDAAFRGSTGAVRLSQPIVGMASTPGGGGYWLVAADGGVFAFGDAPFAGSSAGKANSHDVIAILADSDTHGYRVVTASGATWAFRSGAEPNQIINPQTQPAAVSAAAG
jgi:hypothetical protein